MKKITEFAKLASDAEMRESRIYEILDNIDTIASGCTDEETTIRLLNQYALLIVSMPRITPDQPQGEE